MANDGSLIFDTAIDKTGFEKGVSNLTSIATVAVGNIAANIVTTFSSAIAQVPQQMIAVGSSFGTSMSQLAATMGISKATEEMELLTAAAQEMGATTQFTATQAGDALNYLALAGYSAEKSIEALPTVLNLAAAGGMDLAYASDLVTDSMSALGLGMEQLTEFSDQLAVAAQKSNTGVAQLGEAILTVGGTAKIMAGGITEMNTVLGVLADNGIKGAEGGTALRNILLSLSSPTNTAAKAIENLGIKIYDTATGEMRELPTILGEFNTALSSLSQQEKAQALSDIFNKVDLKSINALLGTSAERFDELSDYIEHSTGAAEQMAKTMNDNLKGDLTVLSSALEGVGIAAYNKFETPMRTAVQNVTLIFDELTKRVTSGDLSDNLDKIANGFGKIATSAIELLANNVIPIIINGFSAIAEHGKTIISVMAGVGVAIAAINIAPFVLNFVTGLQAANIQLALLATQSGAAAVTQTALAGGLTLSELAVGLFTGKITLATAATGAFNTVLNANPIALVATGVGIAAAALIGFALNSDKAAESTNKYADAMERAVESGKDIEENANTEIALLKHKADRYEELRSKISELNKSEMAEFLDLADELKTILPEGTRLIDEQTGAYLSLADSIDEVIKRMRTQALLRSKQEAYDTAVSQNYEIDDHIDEINKKVKDRIQNDPEGLFAHETDSQYANALAKKLYGLSYDDLVKQQQENLKVIEGYEEISRSLYDAENNANEQTYNYISTAEMNAREIAEKTTQINKELADKLVKEQKKSSEKLAQGWKEINHSNAIGDTSDEEAYNQKLDLLEKYGDNSIEAHWSYYEEIAKIDKRAAEDLIEQQKRERLDQLDAQEKALAEQTKMREKVLAEQKRIQEQALAEQERTVSSGISDILNVYDSMYKELESKRKSYKNRLLAISGDIFEVLTETDKKTGEEVKVFQISDIDKQMQEMRKYNEEIKRRKAEGFSEVFFDEITSMSADESKAFSSYINSMSLSEREQLKRLYDEKQQLADELSMDMFKDEAQQIQDTFTSSLVDLANNSYDFGIMSAQNFSDAFSIELKKQMDNMKLSVSAEQQSNVSKLVTGSATTKDFENVKSNNKLTAEITVNSTVDLDGKVLTETVNKTNAEIDFKEGK